MVAKGVSKLLRREWRQALRDVNGLQLLIIVGNKVLGRMSVTVECASLNVTVLEDTGSNRGRRACATDCELSGEVRPCGATYASEPSAESPSSRTSSSFLSVSERSGRVNQASHLKIISYLKHILSRSRRRGGRRLSGRNGGSGCGGTGAGLRGTGRLRRLFLWLIGHGYCWSVCERD